MKRGHVSPPPIASVSREISTGQQSAEGAGLVQSHISDRPSDSAISATFYADLVKVRTFGNEHVGGAKRSRITDFTAQSRKRFLETFAKCRNIDGGVFATLTYPNEFPFDPAVWKRDLAALRKRMEREYPQCGAFWRLELKRRKSGTNIGQIAPHYHLVVIGLGVTVMSFRKWVKQAWYEVVGSGDEKHLAAGTQADIIFSRIHATRYVSKYAAKVSVTDDELDDANSLARMRGVGRWWGYFGKLDFSHIAVYTMTKPQYIELKRLVVRWLFARGSKFYRRLRRFSPDKGMAAFGLGDQSCPLWKVPFASTIARMCDAVGASLIVVYGAP